MLGELLVLAYFEDTKRNSPWNGALIPTFREHHESLLKDFRFLKIHPVLGKWLYLSREQSGFQAKAKKILAVIADRDPRIGIIRGEKHRKRQLKGDDIRIDHARNLGPKSAEALLDLKIASLRDLKRIGWEKTLGNLYRRNPRFCTLSMARALIGAIENIDWREIPKSDLLHARQVLREIKGF